MILLDIASWWSEKILFEQVFWCFAVPATVVLVILLISTFVGGDGDVDADVDAEIDADDGAGFQFFTFKNLVGFFTIFGWVGIGCVKGGYGQGMTLFVASISGLFMMTAMATIFYMMSKLVEDGTFKMANAVGRLGEVYLTIPAKGTGMGKVQLNVQGTVRELDAICRDDESIPTGTVVKVIELIDNHILLVQRN